MKWQYKGEWFETVKLDWDKIYNNLHYPLSEQLGEWVDYSSIVFIPRFEITDGIFRPWANDILVYIPKYDKCYTIQRFGIMGNGNKLKMGIEDIYTRKFFYVMAKDVELVTKL